MTSKYDSEGISLDRYEDTLARLEALAVEKFGEGIVTDADEFLGDLARNIALLAHENNEIIQAVYDSVSVTNASGAGLDNILEVIGLFRQSDEYSTSILKFTASKATTVPQGTQVKTSSNLVFETDESLVFAAAGTKTVGSTCTIVGENNAGIGDINTLNTSVYGISSVTNEAAAIPGRSRETDSEFKALHTVAVSTSGNDDTASIYQAVSAVSGVSAVDVDDNLTDDTVNGLPPHNIHTVVIGGSDEDVANAIYSNKTSGVPLYGSESVQVYNEITHKAKTIKFSRGTNVDTYISLNISLVAGKYGDDYLEQITDNFVAHFDELELGQDIEYNALFAPVYSVPGVRLNTLYTGLAPAPAGTVDIEMTSVQKATIESANITITVS